MAKLEQSLSGHTSDINGLSFSADTLASCSSDRTVRLWSLRDFSELPCSPLVTHTYPVHDCVFSPDGKVLASCSTDGKCILWDSHTGEVLTHLTHPSGCSIRTCRFSTNGQLLATGCDDNKIAIWHVATRQLLKMLSGHEASIPALAFTPDNSFMVSGTIEGHLFFWEAAYGHAKSIKYENDAHDLGVTCCQFSPTYGTAAHGPLPAGAESHFLLATGGFDNMLKLWDFHGTAGTTKVSVSVRCTLEGHGEPVLCLNFSPDGATIVSGSNDHTIRIWDTFKGLELQSVDAHTRYVTSCAFSRDGRLIASASNDKIINIWRTSAAKQEQNDVDLIKFESSEPSEASCGSPSKTGAQVKLPEQWDVSEVVQFLAQLGLSQYAHTFRGNAIDGVELLTLNHNTLQTSLKVEALGHRNKIVRAIEQIEKHPLKQPAVRHSSLHKDDQVPEEYLCPITMETMKDPVIASDGYTYERAAISNWMASGKQRSPMTNAVLPGNQLTPNRSLKILIQKHLTAHP